jgi:hypothetical protein
MMAATCFCQAQDSLRRPEDDGCGDTDGRRERVRSRQSEFGAVQGHELAVHVSTL